MSLKKQPRHRDRISAKHSPARYAPAESGRAQAPARHDSALLAAHDPASLTPRDVLQLQRTVGNRAVSQLLARTARGQSARSKTEENKTGLPDSLKAGAEALSGLSLDDVRVHYDSPEPARLGAAAFARGTDIHVAPEQKQHLAHEAWHVVQQKQGRVKGNDGINRLRINEEPSLESEADRFGRLALQAGQNISARRRDAADGVSPPAGAPRPAGASAGAARVIQPKKKKLTAKQEESRDRLLEKRAIRQERYAAEEARRREKEKKFWDKWLEEIESKDEKLLHSKEVKRAVKDKTLNKDKWESAVAALLENLRDVNGDNSLSKRNELRAQLGAAWKQKEVGPEGQKKNVSSMPSKMWNIIQEIFDARTIYHNRGVMLLPGGEGVIEGKEESTPDYVTTGGVGDAINLEPTSAANTIKEAVKAVTSKVAAYPGARVTVVIGAHKNPELLSMEKLTELYQRVSELAAKPETVYVVSGSYSALAYPYPAVR